MSRILCHTVLLLALTASGALAQIVNWQMGGTRGLAWADFDSTHVLIDFERTSGAIQPTYITPDRSVYSFLENWTSFKNPGGRDLSFVAGERPRAWKGSGGGDQPDNNAFFLIDGDSSSYNPPTSNSIGNEWYTFDTAVPIPVYRVDFFTPQQGFRSDGKPLREDAVPAFELSIQEDETVETAEGSYARLAHLLADIQENVQPFLSYGFTKQYIRYVRYQRKSSLLDAFTDASVGGSGQARIGTIGDFYVVGEGVPKRVSYISKIIDLGNTVNFGRIHWAATPMRMVDGVPVEDPDADVSIEIIARTGLDADPNLYFEYTDTGSRVIVSRDRYENDLKPANRTTQDGLGGVVIAGGGNKPGVQAGFEEDTQSWTFWSIPLTESGQPLGLNAGSHIQFKIQLQTNEFDAFLRLDSLWVEQAPLLVRNVQGELARLDDPAPQRGFTEVELGERTDFVYDIRAEFDDASQEGFDAIRIISGSPSEFKRLEMGSPLAEVTPEEVIVEDEGLTIYLPERITRTANKPLRVVMGTEIFLIATVFQTQIFDRENETLAQLVEAGDVSDEINTSSLRVLGKAGKEPDLIQNVTFSTKTLTPNGDGANDVLRVNYSLFRVPGNIPVEFNVFSLDGERVASLAAGEQNSGTQSLEWDGRDQNGKVLSPGIYLFDLSIDAESETFHKVQPIGIAY
jgi:hypothetical protein